MQGRRRRLLVRIAGSVLVALGLAALTWWQQPQGRLARFEGTATDLASPRGEVDPDLVVVAIDHRSLAEVGDPWPWPRPRHAELVGLLSDLGARTIVLDVLFANPEPGDEVLAEALRAAGNVVLATATLPGPGDRTSGGVPTASLVVAPVDELASAARALGHVQVAPSAVDGIVRTVPLAVEGPDRRIVPALALAATATAVDQPSDVIIRRPSGVQVAGRTIPTDRSYGLQISWSPELSTDRTTGPILAAADVLSRSVPTSDIAGKVVFVGVTDPALGDRVLTPVAKSGGLPGVMVHAAAYDTMASRAYLSAASTTEVVLTVAVLALLVALAVQVLPLVPAGAAVVALVALFLMGAYVRADAGTLTSFMFPTLAMAVAVPLSGGLRYVVDARHRRRISDLFGQYVPQQVAAQLVDDGLAEAAIAGQRCEVSALFCDLRGFTALSARVPPSTVSGMLALYYEYASAIVLEHGGTLMQYVGDEVFAVFGAPIEQADEASRAVATARALQERLDELDHALLAEGHEVVRFGIGVNRGEVVAAHAGSSWRRQYTVIGDPINVAARLCSQAGPGQVVISEEVRAAAEPAPEVEPLGERAMKGVRPDLVAWKVVLDRPPSGTAER